MIAAGAHVHLLVATDGRRGSFEHDSTSLAALRARRGVGRRRRSAPNPPSCSATRTWSSIASPAGTLREAFIRAIRQIRPDAVVAEDPFAPYDPHPDHRAVAWAASDALSFSHLPLMHPEHLVEGLQPHFVVEKYFYSETCPAPTASSMSAARWRSSCGRWQNTRRRSTSWWRTCCVGRLAGVDVESVLGTMAAEPRLALDWALRAQAAEVGARIGVAYGEAFRYVRFHPIVEGLLST